MAVVVYRCDTCKRTIEIKQNVRGLEHIGRCNITHGCRGHLSQVDLHPDYLRGSLPTRVEGLEDWQQRQMLYNHDQPIKNVEWIIEHNLGTVPEYIVYVDRPTESDLEARIRIEPQSVVIINSDTIKLVFDRAWSGIAQLIAKESDPDLFKPYKRVVTTSTAPVQMSVSGYITVATLSTSTNINLRVQYTTSTGIPLYIEYNVDNIPNLDSPWNDYEYVVIENRRYLVRSFNGIVPEMLTNEINSGSQMMFLDYDPNGTSAHNPIPSRTMLILLAQSPFTNVDKIKNSFVDVTSVTPANNPFGFIFSNGEYFAERTIIRNTYPLIQQYR